jgi:hypothetical protein
MCLCNLAVRLSMRMTRNNPHRPLGQLARRWAHRMAGMMSNNQRRYIYEDDLTDTS